MFALDPAAPDALTGLPTRRQFLPAAGTMLADASAAPVALILANIDDCKRFNGCHGHVVGDRLICEVARAVRDLSRPRDALARVGGDTFALLVPRTSQSDALAIAEALRRRVETTPVPTDEGERAARISVGVAMADGRDITALMAAADDALYAAKRAGRNRVALFGPATPPADVRAQTDVRRPLE